MMDKTGLLTAIAACFVLTFVAFWFDSFILTLVVCGLQVWASAWLVALYNYKWGVTQNPRFILCFGFGEGCKALGVLMLLFPPSGFSMFSTLYTVGTICSLGSILFLMEHSVLVKINETVEAKVKTTVNGASAQIIRLSKELENVCDKYLDDSAWKTYTEWYNGDIGGIVQGLCALLFPQLGVLLLTLTAVVDVGVRTRERIGTVVLGALGAMVVLVFVGLAGLGGLGLCCLGGLAALTFGGLSGLGTLIFWGLNGLAFLALEVFFGLVALILGGLGGLCVLAIGSLGGLAAVTLGVGGKENQPNTAVVLGALGGLAALALGDLGVLGSLTLGGLSGLAGQALGVQGLSGGVRGQRKPASSTKRPVEEHDKRPKDGRNVKITDEKSNTLEDKIKHKLVKALHYLTLATVLWYRGPALFLLILQCVLWALFYTTCRCTKSTSAIVYFVFGAGCTMMGVYLRFVPGFSLLLFSVLYTVGNVFILESTLLLKDLSKQQMVIFGNTRRAVTSVILSCLGLTLLALFWWQSFGLSLMFCILHISSRYFLTLCRMEVP